MNDFFFLATLDDREVALTDEMQIGRGSDCDLVLTEGHPSRHHARLWIEAGQLWLEDLGSANGTFVNDRPVTVPQAIKAGDTVRFDVESYQLCQHGGDAEATVVRAADPDATVIRPATNESTDTPVDSPAVTPLTTPAVAPAASAAALGPAPKSWQAGGEDDGLGTRPLSPEELAEIRGIQSHQSIEVGEQPILHVRSGTRTGEAIDLVGEDRQWSIGSDPEADLHFSDENVSTEQAILSVNNGRWKLADQFSKNRTYVNGQQTNVSYLNSGDSIAFGGVQCVIALPKGVARDMDFQTPTKPSLSLWQIAAISFGVTVIATLVLVWWYNS